MTTSLIDRLTRGARPLLWDGGVGTALIARGLDLTQATPESWLRERPDDVRAVHADFARAGADVVQTNSFGLLRQMLSSGRPDTEFAELVKRCVDLAQAGAAQRPDRPALVVASLGPVMTAATDASFTERLFAAAERLTTWFAAAGVAALHLETACEPAELATTLSGARAASSRLPILVSMTVSAGQSGFETPLGVPLSRMLQATLRLSPDAVGLNCSLHARRMRQAVATLRELSGGRLPLIAQPQVDQAAPDCKRPATPETPERFGQDLLGLLEAGADAVGGCCGAQAAHIAAARQSIDRAF